jgi:hypothetical protein
MFIPTGRLSAVEKDGEKVQIQTEFGLYPKPRVTTTVILSGRVLHKQQKEWDAETETQDGQHELEVFLNKQHVDIHKRVESDDLFIEKIAAVQAAVAPVQMPGVPQTNPEPVKPARHPVADTPGVERLFIVSKSGDLLAADDTGEPRDSATELFVVVSEFIEFWEESESERFASMYTQGRSENYILARHFGKYWGAEIASNVDPDQTRKLFLAALEKQQ